MPITTLGKVLAALESVIPNQVVETEDFVLVRLPSAAATNVVHRQFLQSDVFRVDQAYSVVENVDRRGFAILVHKGKEEK